MCRFLGMAHCLVERASPKSTSQSVRGGGSRRLNAHAQRRWANVRTKSAPSPTPGDACSVLLGWYVDVSRVSMGRGYPITLLTKPLKVKPDGFAHGFFNAGTGAPSSDTTGKVRGVGRVTSLGFLDDDEVSHGFNPACLNILLSVPGAKSELAFPAMVTSPGFLACLNWR